MPLLAHVSSTTVALLSASLHYSYLMYARNACCAMMRRMVWLQANLK